MLAGSFFSPSTVELNTGWTQEFQSYIGEELRALVPPTDLL